MSVYDDVSGLDPEWIGVKSLIAVERKTTYIDTKRKLKKTRQELSYYISSLSATRPASEFSTGIRGHWGIESMHYIKDTTFKEDSSKVRRGFGPKNLSLVRSMVINILRKSEEDSIVGGIRKIAHNIPVLAELVLE